MNISCNFWTAIHWSIQSLNSCFLPFTTLSTQWWSSKFFTKIILFGFKRYSGNIHFGSMCTKLYEKTCEIWHQVNWHLPPTFSYIFLNKSLSYHQSCSLLDFLRQYHCFMDENIVIIWKRHYINSGLCGIYGYWRLYKHRFIMQADILKLATLLQMYLFL